jgi:hypothetical protein
MGESFPADLQSNQVAFPSEPEPKPKKKKKPVALSPFTGGRNGDDFDDDGKQRTPLEQLAGYFFGDNQDDSPSAAKNKPNSGNVSLYSEKPMIRSPRPQLREPSPLPNAW